MFWYLIFTFFNTTFVVCTQELFYLGQVPDLEGQYSLILILSSVYLDLEGLA